MERKSLSTSYVLFAMTAFGMAGVHRFYLGKPVSGLLWLCTWGLFGLGTVVDLFLIPHMVESENLRMSLQSLQSGHRPPQLSAPRKEETPEQKVLQSANQRGGKVTVAMVSFDTGIPMKRTQSLLESLVKGGFVEKDVNMEGADLYVFPGLLSNEPFDLEKV